MKPFYTVIRNDPNKHHRAETKQDDTVLSQYLDQGGGDYAECYDWATIPPSSSL